MSSRSLQASASCIAIGSTRSGVHPRGACRSDFQKIVARIMKLQYHVPEKLSLSPAVTHLLSRIFVKDPADRITIAEIKQHSWYLHRLPYELHEGYRGFERCVCLTHLLQFSRSLHFRRHLQWWPCCECRSCTKAAVALLLPVSLQSAHAAHAAAGRHGTPEGCAEQRCSDARCCHSWGCGCALSIVQPWTSCHIYETLIYTTATYSSF